jgi:S1-C subfamily serine protease
MLSQGTERQGKTDMKIHLLGLSCCILVIASMFLSTIPVTAVPLFADSSSSSTATPSDSGRNLKSLGQGTTRESAGELKEKRLNDLLNGASTGTAWPIAPGYVVTNSHVVSESNKAILISAEGREIPAWTVLRDEANDICLLEVNDPKALPPALPLAQSQTRLGASVFTIGFPRVDFMGRTPKLSTGVVSGENGLRDDPASFQTTVPIQLGNSGGPLLNMKGEVVGVVRSMLGIRDTANGSLYMLQTTSCALKIRDVRELLGRLPSKGPQIQVLPSLSDDLETLASRIKDSVLLVISR